MEATTRFPFILRKLFSVKKQTEAQSTTETKSMEASTQFPFMINGVVEPDIARIFFASTAHLDTPTLLKLRLVSKAYRNGIDSHTTLWSRVLPSGDTPLHLAAGNGQLDIVQFIIARVDDPNPAGQDGATPLHVAAFNGHLDIVQFIIERAEDPNPADQYGTTPLHLAARTGRMDIVQFIIERVDDPNPRRHDGVTVLHLAARNGYVDIVQFFIERVDNLNPLDQRGITPQEVAEWHGHQEVCQLIKNAMARRDLSLLLLSLEI